MLWDAFHGEVADEIVERDDGYIDSYSGWYLTDSREWPAYEKKALRLARGRVLDIGCGAGRIGLHFQKRGLEVLGIDISPLALRVCEERGMTNTRLLSITQIGPSLGRFDTILMWGNNFGLMGSFRRARQILGRFRAVTNTNALILAQTLDPYQTNDKAHLRYHRLNRRRGRMSGQLRLRVRYHECVSPWLDYLFVSRDEMRSILAGTGWRLRQCIESGGAQYIAVIEKE